MWYQKQVSSILACHRYVRIHTFDTLLPDYIVQTRAGRCLSAIRYVHMRSIREYPDRRYGKEGFQLHTKWRSVSNSITTTVFPINSGRHFIGRAFVYPLITSTRHAAGALPFRRHRGSSKTVVLSIFGTRLLSSKTEFSKRLHHPRWCCVLHANDLFVITRSQMLLQHQAVQGRSVLTRAKDDMLINGFQCQGHFYHLTFCKLSHLVDGSVGDGSRYFSWMEELKDQ